MSKTIIDVKSALEKLEGGNDLYEVVSTLVNEAENAKKSFNTLNSTHNKIVGQLKTLGYGGGDASPFLDELKIKIDKAADLETEVADKVKKVTGTQAEMALMKKEVLELKQSITAKETALKHRTVKDMLIPLMRDRIFSADLRAKELIESGRVDMDSEGRLVFKKGDELVPVNNGLEEYFKDPANQESLKNAQKPGSGGGNLGSGNPNVKIIPKAEFDKLSPPERRKFFQDGGDLTD